jgi:hypothetical protein
MEDRAETRIGGGEVADLRSKSVLVSTRCSYKHAGGSQHCSSSCDSGSACEWGHADCPDKPQSDAFIQSEQRTERAQHARLWSTIGWPTGSQSKASFAANLRLSAVQRDRQQLTLR